MDQREIEMKACFYCDYYFPADELASHSAKCSKLEKRIECPVCYCEYASTEIEPHAIECKGSENMIRYVSEYSRKKYSYNFIRRLLVVIRQNEKNQNLNGRQVLKIINNNDFDVKDLIENEDDDLTILCPICLIDEPMDNIFVLSCNVAHKVCYNCLYQHSLLSLNAGISLTCPIDNCNHTLHINEVRALPFPQHVVRKLVEKYDQLLLNNYMDNTKGTVKCPNANCCWAVMLFSNDRHNVTCEKCDMHFCSKCKAISHYRIECEDIARTMQEWRQWCHIGREARKKEKNAKTLPNAYKEASKKIRSHNKSVKKAFPQLKNDEKYKVQKCRLCPNCGRIIEKTAMCNEMKCGEDIDGGNVQNGCGHKFDWSKAKPYTSQVGDQPEIEKLILELPNQVENVSHNEILCDKCNKEIFGIRFECINCEFINFCENCEETETTNHKDGHTFKLIFKKIEIKKSGCVLL